MLFQVLLSWDAINMQKLWQWSYVDVTHVWLSVPSFGLWLPQLVFNQISEHYESQASTTFWLMFEKIIFIDIY